MLMLFLFFALVGFLTTLAVVYLVLCRWYVKLLAMRQQEKFDILDFRVIV
jgi:hypothetical protein